MFLLSLLRIAVAVELYEAQLKSSYTLGTNLLANPSFDEPALPSGVGFDIFYSIPGWSCGTECEVQNVALECSRRGWSCDIPWSQGLDMETCGILTNLSQILFIEK